jgi:polyhydroxybutyrate depolymerase
MILLEMNLKKILLFSTFLVLLSACVHSPVTSQNEDDQTLTIPQLESDAPDLQTTLTISTVTTSLEPGNTEHKLSIAGKVRTYFLYVPTEKVHLRDLPVVFIFPGYHMDAKDMRALGLNHMADQKDFLVVYPNGIDLSWNAGGCCGPAAIDNIDDIEFIRLVLSDIKTFASVDQKRIYATGFSNGAMFTYRLACEMSDIFAAIAPLSGPLMYSPCQPQDPVSIMHIHGLADVVVPFSGGLGSASVSKITFPPVAQSISTWVKLDGCSSSAQVEKKGIINQTTYSQCKSGSSIELYTIDGMVHDWPANDVMPTPNMIWAFFAAHPKP